MARALTGPRMQGRLLELLRSEPMRVWTNGELCKALRLDRVEDLDAIATKARTEMQKFSVPYPTCVWGVGYRMSDADPSQQTLPLGAP